MDDTAQGPPVVSLTRDLVLSGVTMRVETQLIDAPVSPRRLLPVLRSVADNLVATATQSAIAQGKPPSCRSGCSACCNYLVPIARAEAYRLRELVDALPEPRRTERRARFAEARTRIIEAGLLAELTSFARMDNLSETTGARYFVAKIPCPFLDAERCSIYAERPLACREFLSLSPAANCAGGPQGEPTEVLLLKLPAYPFRVSNAMDDGPSMSDGGWVPLSLALDYADNHPEDPPVANAPVLVERFFAALEADAARE